MTVLGLCDNNYLGCSFEKRRRYWWGGLSILSLRPVLSPNPLQTLRPSLWSCYCLRLGWGLPVASVSFPETLPSLISHSEWSGASCTSSRMGVTTHHICVPRVVVLCFLRSGLPVFSAFSESQIRSESGVLLSRTAPTRCHSGFQPLGLSAPSYTGQGYGHLGGLWDGC